MPALTGKSAGTLTVLAIAAAMALTPAGPAYAGGRGGGGSQGGTTTTTGGGSSGGTLTASAGGITYDTSKNGSGPSVGGLSAGGDWAPPPCWYAPTWNPAQFRTYVNAIWDEPSVGRDWVSTQQDRYVNGHPYHNYNIAKTGKGYWWNGYANMADIADPAATSCTDPYFWVDTGAPAPVADAISPKILAALAYQRIKVPATRVTLDPVGLQTVNLNTWAWLDKARFKPVSVTARVARLGIFATTTATPIALHLDPGTADATVYPASGDCPINANGSIGTPYRASDGNGVPPCGVTYLHSTTGRAPFALRATITWRVAWTGSGGTGGALPDGTFGTTRAVTVQEVQSVVR